ncbi:MAG: hypothetical protein EOP39_13055 [Rubrivivax sp.]|nr:MAG: hypothetical protein EOP39_13055 [Rubrivivax sp.]
MDETTARLRALAAPRRGLLTWWTPAPGEFSARLVLDDGSMHDFDSPFELARFLSTPMSNAPATSSGLR